MDYESWIVGKMIDPPSGWRYGFPKSFLPMQNETLAKWFIRNGYPTKDIELAIRYSRVIG